MPSTSPRLVTLVATAALALIAACSGGDDDGSSADSTVTESTVESSTSVAFAGGSSTETTPTVADTVESTTSTTAAATTTTIAPEPETDNGECLVGAWTVTQDQMNAFYAGLMAQMDAPLTITATGFANLTLNADGTYAWAPAFDLVVDVAGASGTGATTGSITGTWTAADGVITTSSEVNALVVTVTVNGATFSGSDLANGLLNASPINGVTYSCDGPNPVLDFVTSIPGETIPITLVPA